MILPSLRISAVLFTPLLLVASTFADLPSPRLDRISQLGASAGTSIEVEIQGADLEDVKFLRFDHPGFSAEPVPMKERLFKVTVAADVPAGTYDVRTVGRFGVSNPRLFAVSRGLIDVVEKEPNNDALTAQVVQVNSAVNGTSDGNDQDYFKVPLKKGQRVTFDCQAQRLDVQMDANLAILSAAGAQLASSGDYHGRDPFIDFVAPQDGDYLVVMSDLTFRGGFPYRLVISDRPQVENAFPRAVQLGQNTELTLLGRNFGSAGKPSPFTLFDLPLDEAKFPLTAPTDANDLGLFRFLEHPTAYSVQPTAATCTVSGFQIRPSLGGNDVLNATSLLLVDSSVTLEHEPNDKQDQPQAISLPAVVSGRFDAARDADWYEFQVDKDGSYGLEVYCERIGGQADPYVVLVDEKGTRVQEFDDFGHRMGPFDGHLRDPSGTLNLNANKKYRLLVQDRYRRGGPRYQYVLQIRKPKPDFYLAAINPQNPAPAGLNIWKGGAAYLHLINHQRDGWNEPITITAEGLPPGVHAAPTSLLQENQCGFVLWADENAADFTGPIKLVATAKSGELNLRREVRPYTRVWNDGSGGGGSSRPVRELTLAVREKAPFSLRFATEQIQIEAGKKAQVKLLLTRLNPDFKEKLTLLPLPLPGNVKITAPEIAAGASEATIDLDIQPGTRPGVYTLAIVGQGQVPYSKDPAAKDKPNVLVSLPSQPLTITVLAPPAK
ncbi:MAG: PPC domain-containing protein [Planctomycetales bacterium]|nr:PPC domain-containing protein [Planctomycetales bacterium]